MILQVEKYTVSTLQNGTFSDGLSAWQPLSKRGTVSVKTDNAGNNAACISGHAGLMQRVDMESGRTYRFLADVKTEGACKLKVLIQDMPSGTICEKNFLLPAIIKPYLSISILQEKSRVCHCVRRAERLGLD